MTKLLPIRTIQNRLLGDIRALIENTKVHVAQTANAGLTLLYWNIGRRIRQDILKNKRAEYGERIVPTLSAQLVPHYGEGYSTRALFRTLQFVERFPDGRIVATLSRQLGWSHFTEIISLRDPLQRDFYAEMCRIERWSVRALRTKIGGMLFERTALSRKPALVAKREIQTLRKRDRLTPDLVFRDPYMLDFLQLKGAYQEKDVETTILREMEAFILELEIGFSFIARQKRISVGPDDFYLDLLFYHRGMRRLVAIELKLDKFRPEHKGQMELYLRWLDRHERKPGEAPPMGLILCAGKSDEQIELLQLNRSGIRVAQYLTDLPPRKFFWKGNSTKPSVPPVNDWLVKDNFWHVGKCYLLKISVMKPSNQQCLAAGIVAALFLSTAVVADLPRCDGHGGVVGCDPSSGHVLCKDGTLDVQYPCTVKKAHPKTPPKTPPKASVELKFKPATTNGQILSPGEKPPTTTLQESK